MPRVSVIVPAFNSEATIVAAVDSVLAGSFRDIEVVVADDCSRDHTADLVEAHPDPRTRLVRAEQNGGPAAARNLALARATGELVAFLDADDRWLPHFLTEQVALYDSEAPVGIVSCDAWLVDDRGRRVGRHSDVVGIPAALDLTEMLEANRIFISALCPRAVVEEAGRFSTECYGSEDHDLWLRILENRHRAVYNPEPLALYASGTPGISAGKERMAHTDVATYRRALQRDRMTSDQRRIALRKLKITRAAELVAQARTGPGRARATLKAIPAVAAAAAVDPKAVLLGAAAGLRRPADPTDGVG